MLTPINIPLADLNLPLLAPMLIAIAGGLIILSLDLIKSNLHKSLYVMLSIMILGADLALVLSPHQSERGFFDLLLFDGLSIVAQALIVLGSLLFIPLALTSKRFHEFSYPEFFALFMFMIAGLQFMVTTDNLILIFVGIETSSLALYTLIAMHNRTHSYEAAIKYFTMGAVAAGFYAMGSAAIYATTGSIELWQVAQSLSLGSDGSQALVAGGAILILIAFAFKLSLFPFHTWAPDVYEGTSAPLAGYMSIVPKIAAFAVTLRIFHIYIDLEIEPVQSVILWFAVITMTAANIMALVQQDVKRMLAYSSISHAGFVMAAIAIGITKASTAVFIYYALFMFTNLGAFTMLWISRHKVKEFSDRFDHPYEKFAGMIKIVPIGAVIMALFMLSLAGVPPFSVFWGKLYIMSAAVDAGYIKLALIMGLNSAIAAYYYLKLVVYMFLKEPVKNIDITHYNASKPLMVVVGFAVAVTITSVFFFQSLIAKIYTLMSASGL